MDKEIKSTVPKPFIFVLMPFDKKFNDIYKFGIKGAAEDVEAYAERVDEQIFNEGILDRIFNQINKADVIVADMTDRNPNVFYEVGYAHALGKIVVLLTQKTDDIPFDLKHRQHIVYGGEIDKLRNELSEKLKWAIDESKKQRIKNISDIFSILIDGVEIPEASLSNNIPVLQQHIDVVYFIIQNISMETTHRIEDTHLLTSVDCKIDWYGFKECDGTESNNYFNSTNINNKLIKKFRFKYTIPPLAPGAKHDFHTYFFTKEKAMAGKIDELLMLRIHYLDNYYDFPFKVIDPKN